MNPKRLACVVKNMEKAGLSCILVSAPHSVYYLTGLMVHPGERMLALMIKKTGEVRLFANRLFALSAQPDLPLTEFDDTDDCVRILAAHLPAGKIGVDKLWPSQFTIRLMEARPDLTPVLGSDPVDEARMIKDADEIARMRESSHMNDTVVARLISSLRAGDTELDISARYVKYAKEAGGAGVSFEPLICFGKHCAEPHHASDETKLASGETVILDVGLSHARMMSDMTRTVVLGKATDEMRRVYDIVKRANEAGRRAVRPGVEMRAIDNAARTVIEDAGYGAYFIHRLGHGIGLEVHEPMDASRANARQARAGMTFSIEPGIYLPGRFGVRIEDLVCVTEDGCETLNHLDRDLIEL